MKTQNGPSIKMKNIKAIVTILLIVMIGYVVEHTYFTYKSIEVIPLETAFIEVGSSEYDLQSLIKDINGEIISVKQDVDPNVIGEQEVVLEVKKENLVKEVPMTVSVLDTTEPEIELGDETIYITQGDAYNVRDNVQAVTDSIDGELDYFEETNQSRLKAYNIEIKGDLETVGDHEILVSAVDKSGNIATRTFTVSVVEPEPEPEPVYYSPVYYNLPPNAAGNDLVSIAYSYLGYPYGPGNYPGAFDCSGFVQYVYSQVGISISRSTYTQLYDGSPVSYEDMQPGDIIIWGYGWDSPTHSAMYVGDGMMIHSANYSTGVILSDVGFWINGSGTSIISIRRI